jgi:hypothetical protein
MTEKATNKNKLQTRKERSKIYLVAKIISYFKMVYITWL